MFLVAYMLQKALIISRLTRYDLGFEIEMYLLIRMVIDQNQVFRLLAL